MITALSGAPSWAEEKVVNVQPQLGWITFNDEFAQPTSRAAIGLTADLNLLEWVTQTQGRFFVGPATGVIFSHVGAPDSNFFGTNSYFTFSTTANVLLIPVDLKLGYALTPDAKISFRGGGNILYQSVGNSISMGPHTFTPGHDSQWDIFLNMGLDFEYSIKEGVTLLFRPDLTFTPGEGIFTGTFGVGFKIG
jgi:hypothetical protein